MFTRKSKEGYREIISGVRMKTIVFGEKTLMAEFLLNKGSIISEHSHPNEQTGYLVTGKILLIIGDDVFETAPGDSWSIPENVTHKAEIIEDSVAIEVFSPVREDYLP